jgi:thymidylate synthase (FAD)
VKILDHGYLEYVEHWGSDESIVRAARMSTDKGFLGWGPHVCPDCKAAGRLSENDDLFKTFDDHERALGCKCKGKGKIPGDEGLLAYMWRHEHGTPFEMAGLTIEVQAPIFVFREWHRHRVPFGYNELSARYTPMPDLNYVPTVERIVEGSKETKNKQAAGIVWNCTHDFASSWLEKLEDIYQRCEELYQLGLNHGVPKELARLCVPVGRYSRMRATGNLRGWLAFCKLRMAATAQYEIRQYANAVGQLLGEHFPRTWAIFNGPSR